jgi:hypothetical protein
MIFFSDSQSKKLLSSTPCKEAGKNGNNEEGDEDAVGELVSWKKIFRAHSNKSMILVMKNAFFFSQDKSNNSNQNEDPDYVYESVTSDEDESQAPRAKTRKIRKKQCRITRPPVSILKCKIIK